MIFDLSDLKNFRLGSSKRALKIFENLNPPVYYYLFILLLKPPLSIIYNFFNSKKFSIVNAHLKNSILKKKQKKIYIHAFMHYKFECRREVVRQ